jgi:hypothetical protein
VKAELLALPATLPRPPMADAHTPHGLAPSQLSISQAWASAWCWPEPVPPPWKPASCWLMVFMNSALFCTFSVPKLA